MSVIVPTYNRAGLLGEALASVGRQTFADWECLVSDDGSSDGSLRLLDQVAAEDDRVRPIRGRHCGLLGRVRNRALREARGSLIAFLDDDDLWLPRKLELQVRLLEAEPDVALAFSRAERFGEDRGVFPRRLMPRRPDFERLWRGNFIPCSSVLLRKEALDSAGEFDESLPVAQDYDLWLRVARVAPIRFQAAVLCRYRVHAGAMSADRALEATTLERIYGSLGARWNLPESFLEAGRRHVCRFRKRNAVAA